MSAVKGGEEPTSQCIALRLKRGGGELFVNCKGWCTLEICISGCYMLAGMGVEWWELQDITPTRAGLEIPSFLSEELSGRRLVSCGLGVRRLGISSVEFIPAWPEFLLWAKTCAKHWDQVNPRSLSPKG